jgi:hypothetical protein
MAVFVCPKCRHVQTVDDKHIARIATCPKCKAQGVVEHGISSTEFNPVAEESLRRVIRATGGHLGIRCETWMDSERHINKSSSLRVEWWTVIDESLPIRFAEACGLLVHNGANDYPLDLVYRTTTHLVCHDQTVTAYEVRFMTFNVWGEHTRTLVAGEVRDIAAGRAFRRQQEWHLYSTDEAEEYCVSLGFVSRVKLESGAVRNADPSYILREAQRLCEKVSEADLESKTPKKA